MHYNTTYPISIILLLHFTSSILTCGPNIGRSKQHIKEESCMEYIQMSKLMNYISKCLKMSCVTHKLKGMSLKNDVLSFFFSITFPPRKLASLQGKEHTIPQNSIAINTEGLNVLHNQTFTELFCKRKHFTGDWFFYLLQ